MVRGKDGIYIGWQVFSEYAEHGALISKRMVQHALDVLLGGGKTLETTLGAQGVATLMEQEGRYVSHLLYAVPVKRGSGVEVDEARAAALYRKAAELGDAEAQCNLGDAEAQCNLGVCLRNAIGVEYDDEEAVKWFTKAVEQGHRRACFYLGECWQMGLGVETDPAKAEKYYRKAGDYTDAMFALAHLLTRTDEDEAIELFCQVVKKGEIRGARAITALGN